MIKKTLSFWLTTFIFILCCTYLNIYISHLLGITDQFDSVAAQIFFFKDFYAETACLILLIAGSRIRVKIISIACTGAALCFLLVWVIQLNTLWYSDDFMSFFLLENIGSLALVLHMDSVLHFFIFLFFLVGVYICFFFSLGSAGLQKNLSNISLVLLIVIIAENNLTNVNKDIKNELKIRNHSPVLAFVSTLKDVRQMITEGEIDFRVRRLIRIGKIPDYPMINETLYSSPFPFPLKEGRTQFHDQPNIIVFFVESLSARKVSSYKMNFAQNAPSAQEGLTPNLGRFARQAMTVENYFSHTYSTFRGLRGQNCSMFPYHGGDGAWSMPGFEPPSGPYKCLPHHLHEEGYETIFFGPDVQEHCHFSFQTEQMGFESNIFRREIEKNT